jgi:putative ABC transport system permease protein
VVNILGLSVGLAAFILIGLYVHFELSYDDFHKNSENIYRVATKVTMQGEVINDESETYEGVVDALRNEFKEVRAITVISAFDADGTFIRYEDEKKDIVPMASFRGCYADDSFFSVFTFPLKIGDPRAVLKAPYTAVISATLDSRYFGNAAVGKTLEFTDDDNVPKRLRITGVMKDFPPNSHLKFDIVINLPKEKTDFWMWPGHAYVLLTPDAAQRSIEARLNALALAAGGLKTNRDDYGQVSSFHLQPLQDIHLFSRLESEFEAGVSGEAIYALMVLACIILVIAWVNYINLSTALSAQKVRHIGIRKIVGASKRTLAFQVLTESALYNVLSLIIAFGLAWMLISLFAQLVDLPSNALDLFSRDMWLVAICFFFFSTVLSGGYPALMIVSLYPLRALKGKSPSGRSFLFRKALVVFQFCAAIILMVATGVAYWQLTFMQRRGLGIDVDQVLVIKALNFNKESWSDGAGGYIVDSAYQRNAMLLKQELRNLSGIVNATSVSHLPGQAPSWGSEFKVEDIDPNKAHSLRAIGIDYDFIPTLQVKLLAGRNFSPDFSSDHGNENKRAVIVNESACKLLGFTSPQAAVSRHMTSYWGADYEIIGVVNSFHQVSLKERLTPLYFVLQPRALSYFAVKCKTGDLSRTISQVKASWNRYFPDYPFNYFFLDEYFDRQYQNEQKFRTVLGVFTGLAVFIGCMGLFGLTSHAIVQRTKEIGVRKILGASAFNVVALFSIDLVKIMLIATVVSIPLVYWGVTEWLDNYAYRISLAWWLFATPCVLIAGIALFTVLMQTLKTAYMNPAKTLMHE